MDTDFINAIYETIKLITEEDNGTHRFSKIQKDLLLKFIEFRNYFFEKNQTLFLAAANVENLESMLDKDKFSGLDENKL